MTYQNIALPSRKEEITLQQQLKPHFSDAFPFPANSELTVANRAEYPMVCNCRGCNSVPGSKIFMPEGYCVKCKAKKEIIDGVEETMKNGRKAIKGKCPTCGTVMFKILGGKGSASAPTEAAASGAAKPSPAS